MSAAEDYDPDLDDPELVDEHEEGLAVLLTGYADRAIAGESLDLESACRQHPEFADDLRELWGTVVVTGAAGQHQRQQASTGSEAGMPAFDLPCHFASYMLESELARGGMGIVFRATRISDNQPVAIKMILRGDFASDAERQRFQAEAEAAAKLDHPHIVPIYEIGQFEGRAFFCMKLIQGQSLAERLERGPMPAGRAAQLLSQITSAIEYAHQQGILHRDLKPSNILLDDEGNAYVADFGLAKQQEGSAATLTRTGAILGTPSYMAPEQATGQRGKLSQSTDVYALGAILYHMLTGRPPFLGSSPVETVMMVLEQDPVPPRILNRLANRQLEMVCLRCLQKPTDLRYRSAAALGLDLDRFANNQPISAKVGRFGQVVGNVFRETHHASVMENWGLLWMWHSLVLLVACLITEYLYRREYDWWVYPIVWCVGLGAWAIVFWMIRRKMGPVMLVERQIAHVWAAAMICVAFLFPLEMYLDLKPLDLAPLLGVMAGMVFLVKAGMLSGMFYIPAIVMYLTAVVMVFAPENTSMGIFAFSSSACFFFSGLKYYRRQKQQDRK